MQWGVPFVLCCLFVKLPGNVTSCFAGPVWCVCMPGIPEVWRPQRASAACIMSVLKNTMHWTAAKHFMALLTTYPFP